MTERCCTSQGEDTHIPRDGADGRWGTGALGQAGACSLKGWLTAVLQKCQSYVANASSTLRKKKKKSNSRFQCDTYQFSNAVTKLTHQTRCVTPLGERPH